MRIHVNPRQAPLPRGGSTPSPPSYCDKNWKESMFLKWHDISRKSFATPFIICSFTFMTTLWNIRFQRENNQKISPLSLIPYTLYTTLRPSCLHKQTIITYCNYVALFLNRCDISMIVDRTRSYLLASEPRAAREKSKIMQIKASAHACSQSTTAIPTQNKW